MMARRAQSKATPPQSNTTRSWLWPAAAFAVPLLLYSLTLAPTVTLEDSGSFITAARYLGVAHPSGYPLWCLIAHLFSWLPVGNVAWRINFCSAFFAAAACWLTYLIAYLLSARRAAALTSALVLGASLTLWTQAVIAEVYALNLFLVMLMIYLALRWRADRQWRWLYLLVFCCGLSLSNHPMIVLVVPVVLLWAIWPTGAGLARAGNGEARVRLRQLLAPRVLLICLLLFVAGLTVYLYLPLRARSDPPVNWHRPHTLARTLDHIQRKAYFTTTETDRYLGSTDDVLRHTVAAWKSAAASISWPLSALAALGLVVCFRRRRDVALVTLAIFLLHTAVFNAYVHAQYNDVWRFVHRVYYIPAEAMMVLWLAMGLAAIEAWLRARLTRPTAPSTLARHPDLVTVMLLGLVLIPLLQNFGRADQHDDWRAHDFGLDFLSVLPREAGILPMGDTVTFTCLYLKYVAGHRPDLQILSPFFGWQGEAVSGIFSIDPLTPGVVDRLAWLAGYRSVPYGLGYLYSNDPDLPEPSDADFPILPQPPRDEGLLGEDYDPFVEGLRATYAAYHVRAAARALARGENDLAEESLTRASILNPADPWVSYLLARTYRRYAVHLDRIEDLLTEAEARYNAVVDPAAQRYYPVTRAAIEQLLAEHRAEQ